jgi:hypothetical protein
MNKWLNQSIQLAQQGNYLDRLQDVYKLPKNERRQIPQHIWKEVEEAFRDKDNTKLIHLFLDFELFPIKHSFVAYLRRDAGAIERNPKIVAEIASVIYSMGLEELKIRCEEPKETNRQIGPLFKNFLIREELGLEKMNMSRFKSTDANGIFTGSDAESKDYAAEFLGYTRNKGLDFLARINGKHIIGEAKFLTDFGGHQNAQLDDAYSTLNATVSNAEKILILDGVLFIANTGKMYHSITHQYPNENIMSAILIKDFIAEKLLET